MFLGGIARDHPGGYPGGRARPNNFSIAPVFNSYDIWITPKGGVASKGSCDDEAAK